MTSVPGCSHTTTYATVWLQKQDELRQKPADDDGASIWDWTPPGDLAETAAWKVLRELAMTLSK